MNQKSSVAQTPKFVRWALTSDKLGYQLPILVGIPHIALSDVKIRKAKARDKPHRMYDSLGLFVRVNPNGSRLWRQKYRQAGKERTIAQGP